MIQKILTILAAIAKLFFLWEKETAKRLGAVDLADKLKKTQDEKIRKAKDAAAGNLPDELLFKPKKRERKK